MRSFLGHDRRTQATASLMDDPVQQRQVMGLTARPGVPAPRRDCGRDRPGSASEVSR